MCILQCNNAVAEEMLTPVPSWGHGIAQCMAVICATCMCLAVGRQSATALRYRTCRKASMSAVSRSAALRAAAPVFSADSTPCTVYTRSLNPHVVQPNSALGRARLSCCWWSNHHELALGMV
jgi:hypothetical protein